MYAFEGMSDPDLRLVLELATDEELMEFEEILYGTRFDRLLILLMLFGTEITGLVGLDNSLGFLQIKLDWLGWSLDDSAVVRIYN